MRLWHINLIPYLPKSQLLAQWRELNSIYAKEDKHILINYIYNYPKSYLKTYSDQVVKELKNRGIKFNKERYNKYFDGIEGSSKNFPEHNLDYLYVCYYNLYEKYIRGQRDFSKEIFEKLRNYLFSTTN